jgi:hypothetical protein
LGNFCHGRLEINEAFIISCLPLQNSDVYQNILNAIGSAFSRNQEHPTLEAFANLIPGFSSSNMYSLDFSQLLIVKS